MNREQAINYLICRGFTEYQVSEIVRALTYKPRDCANCKHCVVKDTRTNWGSQETTKIYGCERWECEYEPTTKNDSSGLDKNSKKLEKDFGELGRMTREEREDAIDIIQSILDKYEEDECLATEITIGDEDIKAFKMAIKALEQEPKTGHWIDKEEKIAVCSCCNRNNLLYGDFCKWCGAKMIESEEYNENRRNH